MVELKVVNIMKHDGEGDELGYKSIVNSNELNYNRQYKDTSDYNEFKKIFF